MPRDYLNDAPTTIRRDDRAVTDGEWIKEFLLNADVGTLATVHDGQPFLNQNLFVYDESTHAIYIHTARKGRTRANVEHHEKVSFAVMEMGRLLPADEALEFSVEYAGVVIFGTSTIVEDEDESTRILQLMLDKYAPHLAAGDDYRPPVPEELKRTSVFKVTIDQWSGKKKEVDTFEGAFWYQQQSILESVRARNTWQGTLQAIVIAPNGTDEIQFPDSIEAITGQGLAGDRYCEGTGSFSETAGTGRAVTLVSKEDLDLIAQEHNLPISHAETRRNLLTTGVPLNYLVGKRFKIGNVILEGKRLCEPCNTLAKSSGHGQKLLSAMVHRGGLRCDIIQGGTITSGDSIQPIEIE